MKKTFKKLLSILMVFCMVMGMMPMQAFAAEDYTWDSGTGTLTVNTDAGITAWETAVSASEIKAVVVKDTVATIAGKVFQGLSNLESLTFEGDVTIQNGIVDSVEYYPFSETTKLATITFGGKATLGGGVLKYEESNPNTALKNLSFPAGSTFGSAVFSNCTALEGITFNGDVDITAGGCFYKTTALKKIDFKGESKIDAGAFGNAINITELNFTGKTSIGSGVFMYDSSAPNTTLKKLSFPVGSTFGSAVFRYCTALEEITFNGDVALTSGGSFSNLPALKKIDFKGESNLANDAFGASINLAEINFGGKTSIGSGVFGYNASAPNTALKNLIFPAGSTFSSNVFSFSTALEEITFNGDVTLTSGNCFSNLPALKKIDFKGESNLSSGAFSGTTNLAEINFGGKTSIGSGMFNYTSSPNTALKSLTFPAGSTFSSGIFYGCNALKELVFKGNVDLTAGGSIYNTPALERVEFKGESKLANGTLSNSVKLKTLIFGGKTDIGPNVFIDAGSQQSSGMDSIVVPAGSTIGVNAFKGANITAIEFKDTTPPEFGVDAFAECPQSGIIYVPAEAYASYVVALNGDGSSTDVANPVPLQIKEVLPTTSVTVVKEWSAPEGTVLPEAVEVYLLANGQQVGDTPVRLTANNNWTYTFEGLPVATEDGAEIEYTVAEVEVRGFESSVGEALETEDGIEIAITNTYVPEPVVIEIPVSKKVDNGGNVAFSGEETFGFEVTVLNSNVEEFTVEGNSITVTDSEGGSTTIKITVPAELYEYLCDEGVMITEVAGGTDGWTYSTERYLVMISPNGQYYMLEGEAEDTAVDSIVFTNTYTKNNEQPEAPTTTSVTVTKVWDAPEGTVLPESVEVYLLANGQEVTDSRVSLDAGNQWTYTWTELPVTMEDGTAIVYTVDEVKVEGYEKIVEKAEVPAGIGFTIKNTKDSGEEGGNGGATTPTTPSAPSTPSVPDTSDNTGTLMYLAAMVSSTIALVFVLKKKRNIE